MKRKRWTATQTITTDGGSDGKMQTIEYTEGELKGLTDLCVQEGEAERHPDYLQRTEAVMERRKL